MRAQLPSGGDGVIVQSNGGGGGGGVGPGLGGGVGGFVHFPTAVQSQCAAVHVALFVVHVCGARMRDVALAIATRRSWCRSTGCAATRSAATPIVLFSSTCVGAASGNDVGSG
jgi:hypothetical protein